MSARKYQRIAVLMGGESVEREVSLVSGRECAGALRRNGYDVVEIDAGRDLPKALRTAKPDAVFNALHGRYGEDGCVQGMLEWLRIPYTHSGVATSAIAMDKVRTKGIYATARLPIAPHILATPKEIARHHVMQPPYVVKPIDEGSSVGVVIVPEGVNSPPRLADLVDPGQSEKLMVEAYIPGRELTVTVLGGQPMVVTEIFAQGYYDYHAKYTEGGSRHEVPAKIPAKITAKALECAKTAHEILGCRGASRTDFRYNSEIETADTAKIDEVLILLETNTQPGMTPTSLAPEQAAHRGMTFDALVAWLIEDASLDR